MISRRTTRIAVTVLTVGAMSLAATAGLGSIAGPVVAATCHTTDQNGNTIYYGCGPDDPNYGTATGKPSGSPSPTTTGMPSPAGPASPAPTASGASPRVATTLRLSASAVTYGQGVTATAHGTPSQVLDLYDTPAAQSARVIRTVTVPADGVVTWRGLYLQRNSHLQAHERGNPHLSANLAIVVRSSVTLSAARQGTRRYLLRGSIAPRRSGVLVTVYQVSSTGVTTRLGTARTLSTGAYSVVYTFPSVGRRVLRARTTADTLNTAGLSLQITTSVS